MTQEHLLRETLALIREPLPEPITDIGEFPQQLRRFAALVRGLQRMQGVQPDQETEALRLAVLAFCDHLDARADRLRGLARDIEKKLPRNSLDTEAAAR